MKTMFGSVRPQRKQCSSAERKEYKKFYCGLCMALGSRYDKGARLLLNYDLTNDYLLFSSADGTYEEKEAICPWSWRRRKVRYYDHPALAGYFASLNYLLVYYNLTDDVEDENKLLSRLIVRRMAQRIGQSEEELPKETAQLKDYLNALHEIEKAGRYTPVFSVAAMFGRLLETMVHPPGVNEENAAVLQKLNFWTGVWIYTTDAVSDCLKDDLKGNYNPITSGISGDARKILRSRKEELLDIFRDCRTNILSLTELLPPSAQAGLIQNLFNIGLSPAVRIALEVSKNEFNFKR